MKKKIIIGSLLSILILILLPSINAVEINSINNHKENIINTFMDEQSISLENYLNFKENGLKININDVIIQPQCFAIPYAILTFLLLCLIFGIIGVFGTSITFIINIIIGMIASVFGAFFGILSLIFKVIVAIMNGTVSTISEIINIISNFTAIFINIIKEKFVNIKAFIILLIGLTIDILKIIYDALFPPKICIN